jgi:F420H(2)-dependent quinone reductase
MPQKTPAHDQMDPNRQVIDEFRARGGAVGGRFAGLPWLLLTTVGAVTRCSTGSPRTSRSSSRTRPWPSRRYP